MTIINFALDKILLILAWAFGGNNFNDAQIPLSKENREVFLKAALNYKLAAELFQNRENFKMACSNYKRLFICHKKLSDHFNGALALQNTYRNLILETERLIQIGQIKKAESLKKISLILFNKVFKEFNFAASTLIKQANLCLDLKSKANFLLDAGLAYKKAALFCKYSIEQTFYIKKGNLLLKKAGEIFESLSHLAHKNNKPDLFKEYLESARQAYSTINCKISTDRIIKKIEQQDGS